MASGCILGDCYLCEDPVFEDEVVYVEKLDKFRHDRCRNGRTIEKENELLREELAEYKKWLG